MLKLPPRRDNQIEALQKYTKIQHSLGEAQRDLRVKVKEAREGRIYTDIERADVFKPLTTPIVKILKEGLFITDDKGASIPRIGSNQFVNPTAITDATQQLMIEDDEFRLPAGFSIEEVANKPAVVIKDISTLINSFNDDTYKAGFMDLDNKATANNFMGVGDINLKDFKKGFLTLSIEEDGNPLQLADGTQLEKYAMTEGLMSLFFPRKIIEKYGLKSLMKTEDEEVFAQIVKSIIDQNDEVKDKIFRSSQIQSSVKYRLSQAEGSVAEFKNIPLEQKKLKEMREMSSLTNAEIKEQMKKWDTDPDAVQTLLRQRMRTGENFNKFKEYYADKVFQNKIIGYRTPDNRFLQTNTQMSNYIRGIPDTVAGKAEMDRLIDYNLGFVIIENLIRYALSSKDNDGKTLYSVAEQRQLKEAETLDDFVAVMETTKERLKRERVSQDKKTEEAASELRKKYREKYEQEQEEKETQERLSKSANERKEAEEELKRLTERANKFIELKTKEINELLADEKITRKEKKTKLTELQKVRRKLGFKGDDEKIGQGIEKPQMTVNRDALKNGKLQVKNKNGHLLMNRKCDKDTCDLILKPYHPQKKYSAQAIKNYQDLMKLQNRTDDTTLAKIQKTTTVPTLFNNTDEMIDKLELIIGSKNAGNNSTIMSNEGRMIIDTLLKGNVLTKTEHEQIFKKYFKV